MNLVNQPLVSICCITYNHEKYIRDAIEGFLLQKTTFPIEIIIHDDASTDKTVEIVKEYTERYADRIISIFQSINQYSQGIKPSSNFVWPRARGKYIAICEGDDYWIDPFKLQRHVDFLESHEDYGVVYSDFCSFDQSGLEIRKSFWSKLNFSRRQKNGFIQNDLVKCNFIMTVTTLIRKHALIEVDACISHDNGYVLNIDYTLFLELAKKWKFHYDNNKTAIYRVLRESMSHSDDLNKRLKFIEDTVKISIHYNNKYNIGYDDVFFERVRLSLLLREYSVRKLYRKYINVYYNGIKKDWKNLFVISNYLRLFINYFGKK